MEAVVSIFKGLGVNQSVQYMFVIFAVSFLVFRFLFIEKLSKYVLERNARIEGRKIESEKAYLEAKKIQEDLDLGIRRAHHEAAQWFNQIRASALEQQKKIISEAKQKAALELQSSREMVSQKLDAELNRIQSEIPSLVKIIFEKLSSQRGSTPQEKSLADLMSGVRDTSS